MKSLLNTPLTAIITGAVLIIALLLFGRLIDVALCATILFGTGIVAWTLEQYGHHPPH